MAEQQRTHQNLVTGFADDLLVAGVRQFDQNLGSARCTPKDLAQHQVADHGACIGLDLAGQHVAAGQQHAVVVRRRQRTQFGLDQKIGFELAARRKLAAQRIALDCRIALRGRQHRDEVDLETILVVRRQLAEHRRMAVVPAQHQHAAWRLRAARRLLRRDGRGQRAGRAAPFGIGIVDGQQHQSIFSPYGHAWLRTELRLMLAVDFTNQTTQQGIRKTCREFAKTSPGSRRKLPDVELVADAVRQHLGVEQGQPRLAQVLRDQATQRRVTGDDLERPVIRAARHRHLARVLKLGHDIRRCAPCGQRLTLDRHQSLDGLHIRGNQFAFAEDLAGQNDRRGRAAGDALQMLDVERVAGAQHDVARAAADRRIVAQRLRLRRAHFTGQDHQLQRTRAAAAQEAAQPPG